MAIFLNFQISCFDSILRRKYIFHWTRMVSPRDGTGVKTNLICHERVLFYEIVEKKESCLTERCRCLTEQSKKRQ